MIAALTANEAIAIFVPLGAVLMAAAVAATGYFTKKAIDGLLRFMEQTRAGMARMNIRQAATEVYVFGQGDEETRRKTAIAVAKHLTEQAEILDGPPVIPWAQG